MAGFSSQPWETIKAKVFVIYQSGSAKTVADAERGFLGLGEALAKAQVPLATL
jgi:hypothetical protein